MPRRRARRRADHGRPSPIEQQPAGSRSSYTPSVTQPAFASEHVSAPQLLQLQHTVGNRAVQRLLGSAPAAGTRPLVLQRKLKFKPQDLVGKTSFSAGIKAIRGKPSTFTLIQHDLEAYWAIDRNDPDAGTLRVDKLHSMLARAKDWLSEFDASATAPSESDFKKRAGLNRLVSAIETELPDATFRAKYVKLVKDDEMRNSLNEDLLGGRYAYDKAHKRGLKNNTLKSTELNDNQKRTLLEYKYVKKNLKLTQSELLSLYSYTGDGYELINPAMAQNADWLKANMKRNHKETDTPEKVAKSMEMNREIGAMATSALNKLPDWEQKGQVLFRGETMPSDEARDLKPGATKTYPHFVSTSQSDATPRRMLSTWASPARPYQVLYNIVDTSGRPGKDVSLMAKSGSGESEILFAPGTSFVVVKVISDSFSKKFKEVEVRTA